MFDALLSIRFLLGTLIQWKLTNVQDLRPHSLAFRPQAQDRGRIRGEAFFTGSWSFFSLQLSFFAYS